MPALVVAVLALGLVPQTEKDAQRALEDAKRQAAAVDAAFRTPGEQRTGWKKTTLTASQFAAKAAQATKSLRDTEGTFQTMVRTSDGIGNIHGKLMVKDRSTYRIDVTVMAKEPYSGRLVANGKQRWVRMDQKITGPMPVSKVIPAANGNAVDSFFKDFPRLMFQGFTDGKDAWVPLVAGLGKGMPITVQERRMNVNNRNYLNYRIFGRTKTKAFEIVVDGQQFLPVTVLTSRVDEKGKVWRTQWSGGYRKNDKLKVADFTLKAP